MIKKFLITVMILMLAVNVQAKDNVSVGIVDFVYIMNNSNATKSMNEQIDKKKEEFMELDKKYQAAIVKEQQALSEKKSIVSSVEFEKSRKKLEEKIKEEQAKSRRNRIILENGVSEARKFLDKAIRKYIAKIAEDKGLDLVLPKSQVIISDKELFITDEVLALVNSDLKEVKINFAKAKE